MRLDLSRISAKLARRGLSRRKLAFVAAGTLAVAGVAVVPVLPAFAATSCNVTYNAQPWTESPGTGGYTAYLRITNTGDAWSSWSLQFNLPSGQSFTQGWSANWNPSGTSMSATNMSWNGNVPTGAGVDIGFNGRWSGSFSVPSTLTVNGVTCNGATPATPTSQPPTTTTSQPPTTTTTTTTSQPPTTTTTTTSQPPTTTVTVPPGQKVDNPYEGADGYVNPQWRDKALAEPGGSRIANESTGLWLDTIGAIEGDP